MDGVDPAEEFKQEAGELLVQLEEALLNLEVSPDDADLVDSAFRALHSLKGAGMMFGWDTLAAFIHQVETTLVRVRNGVLLVTPQLVALALLVADHIRSLLERSEDVDPARGTILLAAIAELTTEQPPATPSTTVVNGLIPVNLKSMPIQPLNQHLIEADQMSKDWGTALLGDVQFLHPPATKVRDTAAASGTLRVPVKQLNHLMDQVAELVVIQERLSRVMEVETSPVLKSIAKDIERLAAGLRDTTMTLRMLPIGALFRRFRRVAHDLAYELGKKVELTLSGEATTLDKLLIEGLHDPLVHLIRNAIDHGIESPSERIAAGKPAVGRLLLGALHSGEQVVITIKDDGRGLDRVAIRAKAEQCGLLQSGQEVSTVELFRYILQPGFSTAVEVTNVSGRGVGMDVVRRAIDTLHGAIELESEQGQGTAIILKLPLTLAIIDSLLMRVGEGFHVR
ncbi:Histidine kinase [Gammaproteobacteria bacterium]